MNLVTYKNLYANFITHFEGKGNEVVMEYTKRSGVYKVTKLVNWNEASVKWFECPVEAKNEFRNQIKGI